MIELNRRDFLKGCCAAALVGQSGSKAYGYFDSTTAASNDTLIVVFLRGAMDGLSLLSPGASSADRGAYETARVSTRVPLTGTGAAHALAGGQWGLHPRATQLYNLYQSQHLAVVLGTGQVNTPVVRSHFEAQANLEIGMGGQQGSGVGWLTRHLSCAGLPPSVPLPAVSMGSITATSLLSSTEAITMGSGADFRLDTFHWSWGENDPTYGIVGASNSLGPLWGGASALDAAGTETLASLALLKPINFGIYDATNNPGGYRPAGGAVYDGGGFGTQLRNVAQLIKQNVGLRIATIDLGGWDTHNGQGKPSDTYDYFGNQVQLLSDGLGALYTDLSAGATNYMQQTSVVVVSEFGRRVKENESGGTDHGYGNVMLALGGKVNGGRTFGTFPGLADTALFQGADVAVTTDYRQVLGEALIRRLANPHLYFVFPGYSGYQPLGIFQGTDLPPDGYDAIFKNGFD